MSKRRKNPNAMTIDEYRSIKEALKTEPVNSDTAKKLGRGTTTLSLIRRSSSFKNYLELRRKNRGDKKTAKTPVAEVNHSKAHKIKVTGRAEKPKKIAVVRKGKVYDRDDFVVVPAALFEALSDQMKELSNELAVTNKNLEAHHQSNMHTVSYIFDDIPTKESEQDSFRVRLVSKINEIRNRWGMK